MRIALLLFVLLLASCGGNVDRDVPGMVGMGERSGFVQRSAPQPEQAPEPREALARGFFQRGSHFGRGLVQLTHDDEGVYLELQGFLSDPGEDLHLYLSSDLQSSLSADLGPLKALNGTQEYLVPEGAEAYPYALVYSAKEGEVWSWARIE